MVHGILRYGAHLPAFRLAREEIATALGVAPMRGSRTVASYDEDTTTLGVEAAREVVADGDGRPAALFFATTAPAYVDKTNATAIHAALGLESDCFAADTGGAVRSGVAALLSAAQSAGLAVLSDIRVGLPGSADEHSGGDGAAAFLFGGGDGVVADLLGTASTTAEFLDRWRVPGELHSRVWEERFGAAMYEPLIRDTARRALEQAGVAHADHVVVSSPHSRAARTGLKTFAERSRPEPLDGTMGHCGAADAGVGLADVLDRAGAGETILLVVASDGCDALVLRTRDALVSRRQERSVRAQLAAGRPVSYGSYLSWRGLLPREPPRRPDPPVPAPPASARRDAWKFGLVGSRCRRCGTAHLPPARVCVRCQAVDEMDPERFAQRRGRVATFTIDHLAWSMSPPVVAAAVDFDGGGRLLCELTDVDPETVQIGTRVAMTFRRLYSAGGVHNYFWKARPVEDG